MMYHDEVVSLRGTLKVGFSGTYAYVAHVTRRSVRDVLDLRWHFDGNLITIHANVLGPTDAWLRGALVLRYGP